MNVGIDPTPINLNSIANTQASLLSSFAPPKPTSDSIDLSSLSDAELTALLEDNEQVLRSDLETSQLESKSNLQQVLASPGLSATEAQKLVKQYEEELIALTLNYRTQIDQLLSLSESSPLSQQQFEQSLASKPLISDSNIQNLSTVTVKDQQVALPLSTFNGLVRSTQFKRIKGKSQFNKKTIDSLVKKSGLQIQPRKTLKKGILSPLVLKPTKSGLLSAISSKPKPRNSPGPKATGLKIANVTRAGIQNSRDANNKSKLLKKPSLRNVKHVKPNVKLNQLKTKYIKKNHTPQKNSAKDYTDRKKMINILKGKSNKFNLRNSRIKKNLISKDSIRKELLRRQLRRRLKKSKSIGF